jgi:hypothetical protein
LELSIGELFNNESFDEELFDEELLSDKLFNDELFIAELFVDDSFMSWSSARELSVVRGAPEVPAPARLKSPRLTTVFAGDH